MVMLTRISRSLHGTMGRQALTRRAPGGGQGANMGQMLRDDGERWGKMIAALGGLALD